MSFASTTPRGIALPVEALSRGTREQLFLSLRLALAACYARRGAPLPLVLDDVLVNFDIERAKAAAAVLRDFAAAGHQVLIFTCHEHILRLFNRCRRPPPVCQTIATLSPRRSFSRSPGRRRPRGVVDRLPVRAAPPLAWRRRSQRKTPAMKRTSSPTRAGTATRSRMKKAAMRKRHRASASGCRHAVFSTSVRQRRRTSIVIQPR